jgi:hypothetical protein
MPSYGGKVFLVMSATAYLFILTTYLAAKKNFWSDVGEDPGSDPAVATEIDRTLSLLPSPFGATALFPGSLTKLESLRRHEEVSSWHWFRLP